MAHNKLLQVLLLLTLLVKIVTFVDSVTVYWPLVRPRKISIRFNDPTNSESATQNHWSKVESTTDSPIVFPSELAPRMSLDENCSPDYPICTNVIDYPQQLINEIIARQEHRFAEVFGNDIVVDSGDTLEKRFDTSDDEFLCMSEEKLVHPQSGYTIDEKLVMIVNTPSYAQGVRIETCRFAGQACYKLQYFMSMYKTECKQLYHYRTLLAIDPESKQPYKESFRLPSCCKCVIRPLRD